MLFSYIVVVGSVCKRVCVCGFPLGYADVRLFIAYVFVGLVNHVALKFSFSFFLWGWTCDRNFFKFDFVMEYLVYSIYDD